MSGVCLEEWGVMSTSTALLSLLMPYPWYTYRCRGADVRTCTKSVAGACTCNSGNCVTESQLLASLRKRRREGTPAAPALPPSPLPLAPSVRPGE